MYSHRNSRLRLLPALANALFVFLFLVPGARAQFNASLSGSVLDSTGAAIPGATVTLTNPDTKAVRTTTSSATGTYTFSSLPPGNYTVSVSYTGFQQNNISNVSVAAETPRNLDVTLQAGSQGQTVDVNATTIPVLQTNDASIGSTISGEQIQNLPEFGGDPYESLRLAPGMSGDGARAGNGNAVYLPNNVGPGGSNSGIFQTENQVQVLADGQRVTDNNFMIDGVSVNSLSHGGAAVVTPNEEAVGAITTVSTSYDASLGRNSGAQVQVVTKAGTNQLHGSLFFLYDEPGLNEYNKYGGPAPATPTIRNNNQNRTWAASLGGPIIKNKLFAFASFQEYKQSNPSYANQYVPTSQYISALAANRANGVSERIATASNALPHVIATIPLTTASGCSGLTPGTNCAVVNGELDLGSLTPGGASQLGFFPAANTGGGLDGVPDIEYAQVFIPSQSRGNQYNARIDFQPTQKDLIAGSVYFTKLDNLGSSGTAPAAPQSFVPFKPLNSAITLIYIHTFSSTWLNELRGNSTRFADNALNDSGNTVNYGIPYVNIQNYPFPIQYGVTAGTTTPANFAENTYEVRDMVTHTFGAHTIRAGYEARFEQDNDNLYGFERPTYAFNGLFAFANDAAVYEQVYANTATGGPANTQRYLRSQDYAAFVQHDWKASSNLTLNMGLRWEEFTPLNNKGSQINYPVLGPAGTELSGMRLIPHNHLWNFQHNNWGPKFGFAWTPPNLKNRLVMRGGYALAYNHLDFGLFNAAVEDGPGVANFGLCCGGNGNTANIQYRLGTSNSPASYPANPALATGTNANGFPLAVGGGSTTIEVYGAPYVLKIPSSDLYSFEVQSTLGWSTTFTIGYAGATGHHFPRLVDQNFLYNNANTPVFAAYYAQTDSVLNYNAFNAHLDHNLRNNFSFSLVYTYSKTLDQVSNGDYSDGLANQTNPANNASEYGPADYDMKHHFTANAIYITPTIHHANKIVQALLSGYQIAPIFTWHTGLPWTPVTGTYNTVPIVNGAAVQNIVRPLGFQPNAHFSRSCSNSAFETGSNFPLGGSGTFITTLPTGTSYKPGVGRNSFRGPCYVDTDLSLGKQFAFGVMEHATTLRLQANMYNVFNQLQLAPLTFNSPETNITSAYFGYAPAADSGRVIELQARLTF